MYDSGGFPRLEAAASIGPEALLDVWEEFEARGEDTDEARARTAEHLIRMAHLDDALVILGDESDGVRGVRADGLRALALDKRSGPGDAETALEILQRLHRQGASDGETMGLLAGRHKRFGRTAGDRDALQQALDLYRRAWRVRDTYPGINAAALALELEGPEEGQAIAAEVLAALDAAPCENVDRWTYATRGEAHLILGDLDEARRWYRRAVAADPKAVVAIATMRDQARILVGLVGHPEDALDDVFTIRSVAAFTGHRLDGPDEPERFPADLEEDVRVTIRERIQALDVGFAFSSAARGGDLLFLEEVLNRNGSARVFLPFPADAFVETSVGDWEPQFRRVLAHPRVRTVELRPDVPPGAELPAAFAACNDAVRRAAIDFARPFGSEPTLLALWDGEPSRGPGGTGHAVEAWRATGHPVVILDLSEEGRSAGKGLVESARQASPAVPAEPATATAAAERQEAEEATPPSTGNGATRDSTLVSIRSVTPGRVEYEARHCLAIGIDTYPGEGPWTPLKNAVRDAQEVARVLGEHYGFQSRLLSGPEATKQRIGSTVLDELRPVVGREDLVVVYFAGHGHTQSFTFGNEEAGYIAPVDANGPDGAPEVQLSRLISMAHLAEWSAALDARHLLFVFDSCFSGMMLKLGGGASGRPDSAYARLAVTAGTAGQKVLDGPEGGHSPFATALKARLLEGAQDPGGYFTSVELYSHLRRAAETDFPVQTPVLAMLKNHGGGEIVFRPTG